MKNPVLYSGTAGTVGAVYRFPNATFGVDIHVKIDAISNANLVNIDNTATGYDKAWQPIVATYSGGGYIDWTVYFKLAGTNISIPLCSALSAIDIDGNSSDTREYIQADGYSSYNVGTPSDLTLTNPGSGWSLRAQGPLTTYDGIDVNAFNVQVQINYPSLTNFKWRTGATGRSDADPVGGRLFSLYFNTFISCSNVTSGGAIAGNETGCGSSFDPSTITNTTVASGGSGTFEYRWLKNTVSTSLSDTNWEEISGATSQTYDPSSITATTHYRRQARRSGCADWVDASSIVSKYLYTNPTASIGLTENSCTSNDANIISGATVSLAASGGSTYAWDNGLGAGASKTVAPTVSTTYNVTVTDGNGCTATTSRTITIISGITASITAVENSCTSNNDKILSGATVNLTASGGSSYSWNNSLGTGANKSVTPTATTTYTVTVSDANGCTAVAGKTISVVAAPIASITATESSCTSNDDKILSSATVNMTASGGTSYAWDNSLGTGASKSVTPSVTTSYTVTVTDANGCTDTEVKTITIVTNPTVSISAAESSCTSNDDNVLRGASVNLTASGGTSYTWNNSLGSGSSKTANPSATTTYTVTATDANGCTNTANKTITIITAPTANISATETSCAANDDRVSSGSTVNLTASGGTSYSWDNSLGTGATKSVTLTVTTTYTVTATDANGCSAVANKTITIAPGPSISNSTTNVLCNGASTGAINITVTGGSTPYTYNWGGGITTEDRTGLIAGTYNVTVTDANACSQTASFSVTEPAALSISETPIHVACYSASTGAIAISVSGGVTAYTYSWGDGLTTQNRTALAAGTYNLTVTDANGCTINKAITLTQPSAALSLSTSITHIICGSGSGAINLSVTGGTTAYTYDWGSGVTTEDRSGLAAGTYTVTVTDANGCTETSSPTVNRTDPASLSTDVTNISCAGGTGAIDLTASGGSPFTYNWSDGVTTEDRTGLSAGTYSVTVTNTYGCTSTTNATVTTPSVLSLSTSITQVACYGSSTGAIDLTVSGGTAPFIYNWGGGVTSEDRTSLAAGNYAVTVTDANGCTASLSVTVNQATALNLSTSVTQVTCTGGSDGAIDLSVSGGTAGYTYDWGSGVTTQDRTGLSAGTYSVTVTDANGCTAITGATLTAQNALPNPPTGLRH